MKNKVEKFLFIQLQLLLDIFEYELNLWHFDTTIFKDVFLSLISICVWSMKFLGSKFSELSHYKQV